MKKHIVCFGDSNTHGYNAFNNGRFDETERWTCLLQNLLGHEYQILEEGLSGRTTCFEDPLFEGMSGISVILPVLLTHEPVDLLIIMLGTNDTKERFGCTPLLIALGLKRLIDKAISVKDCWKNGRPDILIITPQNIGKEYETAPVAPGMGRGCAEKSAGLAAEFREIARLTGCRYLDANQLITSAPNHVDYMHLTKEGHRELAEALARYIREEVQGFSLKTESD